MLHTRSGRRVRVVVIVGAKYVRMVKHTYCMLARWIVEGNAISTAATAKQRCGHSVSVCEKCSDRNGNIRFRIARPRNGPMNVRRTCEWNRAGTRLYTYIRRI